MVDYYAIPFDFLYKGGIENEEQFNAMIQSACGNDDLQQHAFMCQWIKDVLQKNPLRFILAELYGSDDVAKFLCFAADYIEAFDYDAQDMILDYSYHFGGKRVEAARSKLEGANFKNVDEPKGKGSFGEIMTIEENEIPDYESVFSDELVPLSDEQRLELMTTVFNSDEFDEECMPEIEDCIGCFEMILDENAWSNDTFTAIRKAIQDYKSAL